MLAASLLALGASTKDCEHWATMGECTKNPGFMKTGCASACERLLLDTLPAEECARIWEEGGCARPSTLSQCKTTCLSRLKPTVTDDGEGNCWYWSTDGECEANPVWMKNTCPLSCAKLEQCAVAPASAACARTFECPPKRDEADDCPRRAARGECRPSSVWHSSRMLDQCSLSCHLIDPPSVSKAVTRPGMPDGHAPLLDLPVRRHSPYRCKVGKQAVDSLLVGRCPNRRRHHPWARAVARCPPPSRLEQMTPRLTAPSDSLPSEEEEVGADEAAAAAEAAVHAAAHSERADRMTRALANADADLRAWHAQTRVQTVHDAPRVRIVHNFVTAAEAKALVELAGPSFHRSSTAREGADEKRTSYSASLPMSSPLVRSVRRRISLMCGYPDGNIEPLQAVRYHGGEFYRPHHDYYNSCETWRSGNRHFTFLIYLNDVEGGGETSFPKLNITLNPVAYSALVFNNCLPNGEPDERSLHEGMDVTKGTKYAINGWVRSRSLGGGIPFL